MRRPYDQQTEEELMDAVAGGDLQAFDLLCRRLQPRLYSFCRRHLRQEQAAEDVVQESLLRLFKHRASYVSGKRVSTWLFTIALNLCRDWHRANGRQSSLQEESVAWAAENSRYRHHEPDALSEAERKELAGLLVEALEALPEPAQRLLKMRAEEGLTFEQAAQRMGVKPQAARAAASRAYKKLRDWLQQRLDR